MRYPTRARAVTSFVMAACLLASPAAVLAKKGEKNYKRGLEYEAAQQWDKAAEEFALAVAAAPSETEYQLHYRRSVFNASQVYMQKGKALAQQEEYAGAFQYFRMAFDLDPVNGLAAQEMDRMLRLKGEKEAEGRGRIRAGEQGGAVTPAAYVFRQTPARPAEGPEKLRNINYNSDLKKFIRMLASELGLNVLFDKQTFGTPRNVEVVLQDVTAARALDHVFLQEGLFFQSVDRRTIFVADQGRRPQYQQLVIRTFYLLNADPADAQRLIQQAVPPQQGRQTTVVPNKATNSVTVRDTAENMRLIGEVLRTIDKERAEVVMDVKIYEVSRNDLMQFGNQLGTATSLTSLGGTGSLAVLGGAPAAAKAVSNAATAFGAALVLPTSTLNAWQQKDRTRVLAATQLHAFDGEKSQAHIGKKVPVQTAQVYTGTTTTGGTGTTTGTTAAGVYGSNGYPVIQYQDTGLTLDFTPQIFPNGDVQVKMSITSSDAAGPPLTPTFSERTLSGTARVQDGRTMMIASISQQLQSRAKSGLPLVGLVPVLGRLFTAPTNSDVQTDIVVAVTPHVLRAPAITPFDEKTRPSGSMQSPQPESLEAMLREEEEDGRSELAADAAPAAPPTQAGQVSYLPAPKALAGAVEAALPAGNAARAVPAVNLSPASWELTVKPERPELNRFFTPRQPNLSRSVIARAGKE